MIDIVIPYNGTGDSIFYALRSIEKFFPFSRVFIVTDKECPHLKNVEIIKIGNAHAHNKDANLFDKVIGACENGVGEEFMFWSDDQALLRPYEPMLVHNIRNPITFVPRCKWEMRLVRTGRFIRDTFGRTLEFNFDSHVPQLMKRDNFIKIKKIDYQSGLGFTICTLYFGMFGFGETVEQRNVKATFELGNINFSSAEGKMWAGWDSDSYNNHGVKEWLQNTFPEKSRFET